MKVWVWAILNNFILSYTLLYNLKHSYTILNTLIRSHVKHLYLFLTHSNFTNPKHLKICQPFLNYHENMRSLSVHPNHCKKSFYFSFFIQYKKRKIPSLSKKERKAKFNTDDLIFRKSLVYLLEHYYLYQAMSILSAALLNTTLLNH